MAVCWEYSTFLLIVQAWKEYLMQGELWWVGIIVAELRPQLEAVQVCLGPWMCILGATGASSTSAG